jgi:hypothetical protein
MTAASERYVPKVHPVTRPVEPDDPMSLHATPAPGDPEVMLRCLVQEYAWMGWGGEQILALFRDPCYPALHGLFHLYGEDGLRERLAALLGQIGVFRFRESVSDSPEPVEAESQLVELGIRW